MCKKFVYLMSLVLVVGLSGAVQAYEFTDDFNTPRNYLTEGYYGTGWDGFIGLGPGETANAIQTNEVNHPGALYLESVAARWEPGWEPLGPFLYREVVGDFNATVYVADFAGLDGNTVYHNDSFMLARVPDLAAGGPGEDGVCIHYFATWSGNIGRDFNDNGEDEWGATGDGFSCARYMRLVRSGNIFYFLISFDGVNWTSLDTSGSAFDVDGQSIDRFDLDGLPLQVGLGHCSYSGNIGFVAFDNFKLLYDVANPYARGPSPADEAPDVDVYADLYWVAGDLVQDVNGHELYFGTDFTDVNSGTTPDYIVSDPCKALGTLLFGEEYFWRVDEVNELNTVWPGDVWSFTVDSGKARDPDPRDGEIGVPPSLEKVKWTPGAYAVSQDVYFGTDANNLTVACSGLASDVCECNIPAGYVPLETYTDYYWRVDTDNGALPTTTGDVWTFQTEAIVFEDNFNAPWDFVVDGPGKWDGVLYGDGVTDLVIMADDPCYIDELHIRSGNSYWGFPWDPLGPFLYKEVYGDFTATAKVTYYPGLFEPNNVGAIYNTNCGIMARAELAEAETDPNDPTPEEDWVSIDFFPIWDCGNFVRDTNDGFRLEVCQNGKIWESDVYLRLSRMGNTFIFETSADGNEWVEMACSPRERPDFEGLTLQVGLHHATFATVASSIAFDDFRLVREPWPNSRGARPANNAVNVAINTKLNWTVGDFVQATNGHEVYLGTDEAAVTDANSSSHPGVSYWKVNGPPIDPGLLKLGMEYFWRVDEVNELNTIWTGDVWSFTCADYITVDDFEGYSNRIDLFATWKDGGSGFPYNITSGSNVTLSSEIDPRYYSVPWGRPGVEAPGPVYEGADAMQFAYDNDGATCRYYPGEWEDCYYPPCFSEASAQVSKLPTISNWSYENIKSLSLAYFGDPCNIVGAADQMYITIEDGDTDKATVRYGSDPYEDMNDLKKPKWQEWNIEMQRFVNANGQINLDNIKKVYIGFGDKDSPTCEGSGIVYFDNIRLNLRRCVSERVVGDMTGDCIISFEDFATIADGWLCGAEGSPDANLVGQWKFDEPNGITANDSIGTNHGTVLGGAAMDGSGQLTLDGTDDYVALPIGSIIASLDECSFAAWVDWPGGGQWQRIFDIGHPNEYDPNDPTTDPNRYIFATPSPFRCAITIEGPGAPEQIVDGTPSPMPSGLHCVVVTVDINDANENNTILSLYLDGRLAGRATDANLEPSILGNTPNNWLGRSLYAVDPYLTGSYDEFRIYNRVLSETEVAQLYCSTLARPRGDLNDDGVIDFKDMAMLIDKWLKETLWP